MQRYRKDTIHPSLSQTAKDKSWGSEKLLYKRF